MNSLEQLVRARREAADARRTVAAEIAAEVPRGIRIPRAVLAGKRPESFTRKDKEQFRRFFAAEPYLAAKFTGAFARVDMIMGLPAPGNFTDDQANAIVSDFFRLMGER